jgi:hypothetical protein
MYERWLGNPRQDRSRHSEHGAVLLIGGVGMVLLVGVGAAYSLTLASTGVLATMATVLVTVGLAGLLVLAGVVAARWSPPGGGGEGGLGGVRPEVVPIRPVGEPDAELFRILDDVRFGDLRLRRRAPLCDRRGTA